MSKINLLRNVDCRKYLTQHKNDDGHHKVYINWKSFSMEKIWQNWQNLTNFAKLNPHQKIVCRMALQINRDFGPYVSLPQRQT